MMTTVSRYQPDIGDRVLSKDDDFLRPGIVRDLNATYAWVYWSPGRQTHRIRITSLVPDTPENRLLCHQRRSKKLRREYETSNDRRYVLYKIVLHESGVKPTHPGLMREKPVAVTLPDGEEREIQTLADWDAIRDRMPAGGY